MNHLVCYGPDGSGTWVDDRVVLAHRLMHVSPSSLHEVQPYTQGNLTIVADSRLDNRDELCRTCGVPPAERAFIPDSRLIVLAYEQWGQDSPSHLIGDFAFAIWDSTKQLLFCARDHIGIRPFYYYYDARIFAFASDMLALMVIDGVRDELDETEIGGYLLNHRQAFAQIHYTFRKNIFKLPFAHQLTVDRNGPRLHQYWRPENVPKVRFSSDAAYAWRLRELLETAVHDRLKTVHPVGAHLSGGIDSSSIIVIANRFLRTQGHSLITYSWSPPPAADMAGKGEYRRIQAINQQEDLKTVFAGNLAHDMSDFDISTRPTGSLSIERAVQVDAAQRGIRVILSGWGGDQTASHPGGSVATRLFVTGRWLCLVKNLKGPEQRNMKLRNLKAMVRQFWQAVVFFNLPATVRHRFSFGANFRPPQDDFVRPEFAMRIAPVVRPQPPVRFGSPGAHHVQFDFFNLGIITNRVGAWTWAGAEHHIQYVYPLLDRRIMEFAYGVPDSLYWKNGWKRYLFRLATTDLLPEDMAWNALGNLKHEPGFFSLATDFTAEKLAELADLATRNPDVPWVDTGRLTEALKDINGLHLVDQMAVMRALDCIRIWENWKSANYAPSVDDTGAR